MNITNNPHCLYCVRVHAQVTYLCALFVIMTPAQGSIILKEKQKRQMNKMGLTELSAEEYILMP